MVSVISMRQLSHRHVITMRFAPDGKLMDTPPRVAIAEPQTGHD